MKSLRTRVCPARLLGPALAVLLVAGTLVRPSADTDLTVGGTAVIAYANGDNVRLRSGPSSSDGVIASHPEGSRVQVLAGTFAAADGSTWYQVSIGGQTGYIVSDYLARGDAIHASTSGRVVTTDQVNLRRGPSTSDAVVRTLPRGESLTLTGGRQHGWLSVSAAGGDGWVYGAFVAAPGSTGSPPPATSGGTRYTIDTVHLRSGPGTSFSSIAYLAAGETLQFTGTVESGFAQVSSSHGSGWVYAQYIGTNPPATPAPTPPPAETPTGTRYTIASVHLRADATTESASIRMLDPGVELQLLGEVRNGFARVTSPSGEGWVFAQFIATERPAAPPAPDPEPEPPATPEPVARYTTAAVNLREDASLESTVLSVVPLGTQVSFAGETANGFARVASNGVAGWIASEYLATERPEIPPPAPPAASSLITWPVRGGEWSVLQGYNGSSHQNRSSSWQYLYSLDLVRSSGGTAGQPVYSPVNGTIRWIDEASGGGSIYMGDGLAFAFFHVVLDPSVREGGTVTQGQYLGTIAPAGQLGAGSRPHLHITIWETSDGGNWSRRAIPFTGNVAIQGVSFPATGAANTHRGFTFTP